MTAVGRGSGNRVPQEVEIKTIDLAADVIQVAQQYGELLESLLAQTYPELIVDVLDKGMLMSGELAQLVGLDNLLAEKLRLPVAVVENPGTVVIEGIKTALENLDDFKQSFDYQEVSR